MNFDKLRSIIRIASVIPSTIAFIAPTRRRASSGKEIGIGFLLFVGAFIGTALFVAPNVGFLSPLFSFLGPYAGWVFSAAITWPVLVLFFWLARRGGLHGEIPEAQ